MKATRGVSRRAFLAVGGAAAVTAAIGQKQGGAMGAVVEQFEIVKTDEQWRKELTPQQYRVLRQHGTERAGTSPLDHEKRVGTFVCAACDLPLYASSTKFDSGTGWPSFYRPLANGIGTSIDKSFFSTRTEVHCHRCGGHLGHVFEDGPPPTGLRYCMNGAAMKFVPEASGKS